MPFELVTETRVAASGVDPKTDRLKVTLKDGDVVYFKPDESRRSSNREFVIWVDWELTGHSQLHLISEALQGNWARKGEEGKENWLEKHILKTGASLRFGGFNADTMIEVGGILAPRFSFREEYEYFPFFPDIAKIEPITVEQAVAEIKEKKRLNLPPLPSDIGGGLSD